MKPKSHFIRFIIFIVVLLVIAFNRQYIYLTYQHLAGRVGINLNNIATVSYVNWIKSQPQDLTDDPLAVFLNKKLVFVDRIVNVQTANVLGQHIAQGEKWIQVDLSDQKIYMREGDKIVGEFLVSTGKWAPTPTGEFRIWTKLRYTRMSGGSKALGTYYNLPNVPYVMYYDRGYGIHGAYWHNNFGNPMSHGCTNMKPEEAGIVFAWADVGTRVIVVN